MKKNNWIHEGVQESITTDAGFKTRLVVDGSKQNRDGHDIYTQISAPIGKRSDLFAISADLDLNPSSVVLDSK